MLLHPSSCIEKKPEWVLYNEFILTSRNYIRTVMHVYPEWLFEVAPDYFDLSEDGDFRNNNAKVKLQRIHDVLLKKK